MGSCNSASSCCAAACFFCNLPNTCLRTFQVGTAFLEIGTTNEPWVCFSNTSPISPSSPNLLLLALPCDVSTPFHNTRCLLYHGKKIGSCGQLSFPNGFDKPQNLSDQWLNLHAQLSQFSLLHNVVCFVSHFLLVLFGRGKMFKNVNCANSSCVWTYLMKLQTSK